MQNLFNDIEKEFQLIKKIAQEVMDKRLSDAELAEELFRLIKEGYITEKQGALMLSYYSVAQGPLVSMSFRSVAQSAENKINSDATMKNRMNPDAKKIAKENQRISNNQKLQENPSLGDKSSFLSNLFRNPFTSFKADIEYPNRSSLLEHFDFYQDALIKKKAQENQSLATPTAVHKNQKPMKAGSIAIDGEIKVINPFLPELNAKNDPSTPIKTQDHLTKKDDDIGIDDTEEKIKALEYSSGELHERCVIFEGLIDSLPPDISEAMRDNMSSNHSLPIDILLKSVPDKSDAISKQFSSIHNEYKRIILAVSKVEEHSKALLTATESEGLSGYLLSPPVRTRLNDVYEEQEACKKTLHSLFQDSKTPGFFERLMEKINAILASSNSTPTP